MRFDKTCCTWGYQVAQGIFDKDLNTCVSTKGFKELGKGDLTKDQNHFEKIG